MKWLLLTLCASASVASADPQVVRLRSYTVEGDAIATPLTGQAGDAARGAVLIQQRQKRLCVLCQSRPLPDPRLQGTLAPALTGIGGRLSAGQLRLRIVDMKRLNPSSIMPTYYAAIANGKDTRIAASWRDK